MKVKFSKDELNLLKNNFFKDKTNYDFAVKESEIINIDNSFADEIRDWALEEQQLIGFDEDYELTQEGKILENIIDKLCN
ncbi:hypothetical protein [Flavobacterium covae]|uniref:hypothetical protein n=1 Tax=Flavobacterium covae TaxID=2906076 RepID=UPI000745AD9C|nr:hypothetical protein [Flavobacterium covae]AMA49765.1 hypothetical protein AWN65_09985 [Flavobacterium covae]AND63442.1 hypothetical protein AX766_02885 [Flavobacterium covae]MCJ1808772.1 hypothetical protein [Flavobacterium covae]